MASLVMVLFPVGRIGLAAEVPSNRTTVRSYAFSHPSGIDYSEPAGQPTGEGSFRNGNVSGYPEGVCVPFVVELTNRSEETGDVTVNLVYDYFSSVAGVVGVSRLEAIAQNSGTLRDLRGTDNLSYFQFPDRDLTHLETATLAGSGSTTVEVSGPYAGNDDGGTDAVSDDDEQRHYIVVMEDIPAGETAYLYFCSRLGPDASEFSGSSLSVGVSPPSGGVENTAIDVDSELPSITLTKVVVGGEASADEWSFVVDGVTYDMPDGEEMMTIENVSPNGPHTITEVGPDNYVLTGVSESSENCVIGVYDNEAIASVSFGDPAMNAHCVLINTYSEPEPTTGTITVLKNVVNDDGGQYGESNFTFYIDEAEVERGVATELDPGTYTVSETGPAGYEPTFGGDCSEGGTVILEAGEDLTCTIINDDVAPEITVHKEVVNNQDDDPAEFDLQLDGEVVAQDTAIEVMAGTHTVSEAAYDNYVTTYSGDCDQSGDITAELGGSYICTVTNTYVEPEPGTGTITVIKEVVNSEVDPSTFTLYVSEDIDFLPDETVVSGETNEYEPGTYYIGEDQESDFEASYSESCANGSVELVEGDNIVCIITNTYVDPAPEPGVIVVTKQVINDDGSQLTSEDFLYYIGDEVVTLNEEVEVEAGTYVVSETMADGGILSGYTATFGGGCDEQGSVTVAAGEVVSCEIINDDIAEEEDPTTGTITVQKTVVNDDSGEAEVADFSFWIDEVSVDPAQAVELDPGTYLVSETGPDGYEATFGGDCSEDGTVVLEAGEDLTCTIINDDIAEEEPEYTGTITVVKTVINTDGGTAEVGDFTLYVDETVVVSGETNTFAIGTYVISESYDAGYVGVFSGDCDANGVIDLTADQDLICNIVNDDLAPTVDGGSSTNPGSYLTVITRVVNDDGTGALSPAHFTMTVTDGAMSTYSTFGGVADPGMAGVIPPGPYEVNGEDEDGYSKSMGASCSGNLADGQRATCVVTYDDIPAPATSGPGYDPVDDQDDGSETENGEGTESSPETDPETDPGSDPTTPEPEVLGAFDEDGSTGSQTMTATETSLTDPEPEVQGVSDEEEQLPRTGLPPLASLAILGSLASLGLIVSRRR